MFKRLLFLDLAFLLLSVVSIVSVFATGMGQVRFDDPINLSHNPSDSLSPNIAAIDDQVFVIWHDDQRPGRMNDILLAHSRDRGQVFRTWNLTGDLEMDHSTYPAIAADGENIYASWYSQAHLADRGTWAPYLSRSNDGGESFQPPFDLSGRAAWGAPTLRIQEGVLNLAWAGYDRESSSWDILFAKSTDFGATVSEPVMVSEIARREFGMGGGPNWAMDGDHVYLTWMGRWSYTAKDFDCLFAYSSDGGKSFSETINLSQRSARELTTGCHLAAGDQGSVYAVWSQGRDQLPPIPMDTYFARSTDGGRTFSPRLNLSNNPEASNMGPRVAAAGNNVYVVWDGRTGVSANIFFTRSTDGGKTFSPPQNISQNPRGATGAQILVIEKGALADNGIAEDILYVVWGGYSSITSQIFFSISLDSGATFSPPQNISNSLSYSAGPLIAAAGRDIYVTWTTRLAGNWDVFFVRGHLEFGDKHR